VKYLAPVGFGQSCQKLEEEINVSHGRLLALFS
jgi:hypothetical protein